jgi:replicative DNA helicase
MTTVTFEDDFKDKALALNLRDRNFCERVDGLIKAEFFDSEIDKYILNLVHDHYTKYRINPSPVSLSHQFKEDKAKGTIRKELESSISSKIKQLYAADISDREFIIEKVADFVRRQATIAATMAAADIVDNNGDLNSILPMFQKAIDVGTSDLSSAVDYSEADGIKQRSELRKARLKGDVAYNSVTTGYIDFDKTLFRRGWGKAELSLYMAPSKAGKSIALIDHALRAAEKGYKTLFISLEVSSEIQADRMDANISGVKMDNLYTDIDKVEERVSKWTARAAPLKMHEYPTGTFGVSHLRRLIKKYQAVGVQFDFVVIDYTDIMLSESSAKENIDKSKQVLVDLRALAQSENVAILSATQTNRDGAKVDVIEAIHVAEDYNKIRIADLVISINCNDIEKETGEARLYYAASRNQKAVTITVKRDLSIMRHIKEIVEIKG